MSGETMADFGSGGTIHFSIVDAVSDEIIAVFDALCLASQDRALTDFAMAYPDNHIMGEGKEVRILCAGLTKRGSGWYIRVNSKGRHVIDFGPNDPYSGGC